MKKILSLVAGAAALVLTGCDDVQVSSGASWGVDRISYGRHHGGSWDYRPHMRRRQRNWRDHNDRQWGGRPGWNRGHDRDRHNDHGRPNWGGGHDRPRRDDHAHPGNGGNNRDGVRFGGGMGRGRDGNRPKDSIPFGGGTGGLGNARPGQGRPNHGGPVTQPNHGGNKQGGVRFGGGMGRGRNGGTQQGTIPFGGQKFMGMMQVVSTSAAPALTKEDVAVYGRIGKVYGIGPKTSTRVLESLNRAAVGDFGGLADLGLNKNTLASAKRNNGRLAAAELDRLSRKLGVNQQKLDAMIQDVLGKR